MLGGIADIEEIRARKTVSLNIENRRTEREESMARRLERENTRRAALQLEPLENVEALEAMQTPDIQLDQAAEIITDLAVLREGEVSPTHTVRNE